MMSNFKRIGTTTYAFSALFMAPNCRSSKLVSDDLKTWHLGMVKRYPCFNDKEFYGPSNHFQPYMPLQLNLYLSEPPRFDTL